MKADDKTLESILALDGNPHFTRFLEWLERGRMDALNSLVNSVELAVIHRFQGQAKTLEEISQAVTDARGELQRRTDAARRIKP